jgi:hypothetical protein
MVMSDRYERNVLSRLEELIVLDAREHGNELSAQSVELLERIRAVLNAEEAMYQEKTGSEENEHE